MNVRTLSAALMFLLASSPVSSFRAYQKPAAPKANDQSPRAAADWPAYGNDPGGSRYSPLDQIKRDNVKDLKVAWTYRTGDISIKGRSASKAAFEATPILVDGTLYLSTPFNRVIALDPETGTERWVYDPKINLSINYSEVASRGVSTWLDEKLELGVACRRRIVIATLDARLIALDAATGTPCSGFGRDGQADLTRDVRPVGNPAVEVGQYQVTSPPAVIGDLRGSIESCGNKIKL